MTLTTTTREKFRELFGPTAEYNSDYTDDPEGLVNAGETVLLLYDDVEKFGDTSYQDMLMSRSPWILLEGKE